MSGQNRALNRIVFGGRAARLPTVAEGFESCVVSVNDVVPWAGQVQHVGTRLPGIGRESAKNVMDKYTDTKYVSYGLA